MPKGRTSSALTFLVEPDWLSHPEVEKLAAAGHEVFALGDPTAPYDRVDLVLSPQAHFFDERWLGNPTLLGAAMKRARREKRAAKQIGGSSKVEDAG